MSDDIEYEERSVKLPKDLWNAMDAYSKIANDTVEHVITDGLLVVLCIEAFGSDDPNLNEKMKRLREIRIGRVVKEVI